MSAPTLWNSPSEAKQQYYAQHEQAQYNYKEQGIPLGTTQACGPTEPQPKSFLVELRERQATLRRQIVEHKEQLDIIETLIQVMGGFV